MSITLRQTIRREEIVQEIVVEDDPMPPARETAIEAEFAALPALFERKPARRAIRRAVRGLLTFVPRAA